MKHPVPIGPAAAALAASLAFGAAGEAGEAAVGLGIEDVRRKGRTTGAAFEWRFAPLAVAGPWAVGIGLAAEADADGDVWAGARPWAPGRLARRGGSRRA